MTDEELFKIAVSTRQFEIQMFWQRSNYFMVLNTAIAIGFFAAKAPSYGAVIALLGVGVCVIWCLVNFGSKFWQSRWEEAAARLEAKCAPEAKLFAATRSEVDEEVKKSLASSNHSGLQKWMDEQIIKKPSVSYQMTLLSLSFVVFWTLAFAISVNSIKVGAQPSLPADVPASAPSALRQGRG